MMKKIIFIFSVFFYYLSIGQVSNTFYATSAFDGVAPSMNMCLAKPSDWVSNPTRKYATTIFFVGSGEVGYGPSAQPLCYVNGPNYWIESGWNGVVNTTDSLVPTFNTTLQVPYSTTTDVVYITMIDSFLNAFGNRVDLNRLYVTGLSLGAMGALRALARSPANNIRSKTTSAIIMSSGPDANCPATTNLVSYVNNQGMFLFFSREF